MDICNITKLPCAYCNPCCEHRIRRYKNYLPKNHKCLHCVSVNCDNCGTGQECDSWSDVMDFMNYEGWKKKLVDGEWKHYCPECKESEKK